MGALEPAPPFEGLTIPLGTDAFVAPWLLGRSALLWESPQLFNPRRFLESKSDKAHHPFAWMPFGYGHRSCVGQHLAVAELEAFASALLRRLRFSKASILPGKLPTVEWFLALRIRNGVCLRVEAVS